MLCFFFKLFFHLEIKLKYYYLLIFDLSVPVLSITDTYENIPERKLNSSSAIKLLLRCFASKLRVHWHYADYARNPCC